VDQKYIFALLLSEKSEVCYYFGIQVDVIKRESGDFGHETNMVKLISGQKPNLPSKVG